MRSRYMPSFLPKTPYLNLLLPGTSIQSNTSARIVFFCNPFFTSVLEDSLLNLQFQNRLLGNSHNASESNELLAQARTFPGLLEIFQRPPSVQKFHLPIFSLCLAFPPVPYFDDHLECFFLNAHILTWIQGSRGCIQ